MIGSPSGTHSTLERRTRTRLRPQDDGRGSLKPAGPAASRAILRNRRGTLRPAARRTSVTIWARGDAVPYRLQPPITAYRRRSLSFAGSIEMCRRRRRSGARGRADGAGAASAPGSLMTARGAPSTPEQDIAQSEQGWPQEYPKSQTPAGRRARRETPAGAAVCCRG
jgi:hypothetical protein